VRLTLTPEISAKPVTVKVNNPGGVSLCMATERMAGLFIVVLGGEKVADAPSGSPVTNHLTNPLKELIPVDIEDNLK
jgi:hypothetical protein